MSKILKRKTANKDTNKAGAKIRGTGKRSKAFKKIHDGEEPEPKIKKYKKQKCAYVENGVRCTNNAVGKSTLCKKHGGNPVVKENLINERTHPIASLAKKYDPTRHPTLFIDLSRTGLSDVEIAAEFEVGIDTLRGWAEKYEMFNTAFEIGKALYESWWLQQGRSGLHDRGFNTSLFKFLTANKLGYAEKVETKSLNMNVHGVLMVPDAVSEEEWEKDDEDIIDVNS